MERSISAATICSSAHNMGLKPTKEPVTPIACAIVAPEPLGGLTRCYAPTACHDQH